MTKVLVVGGGTAGTEAAYEATLAGGEVTVVDRAGGPSPPWSAWPELIRSGRLGFEAFSASATGAGTWETLYGTTVTSVAPGSAALLGGNRRSADAVVLATGSGFQPLQLPGLRKRGSFFLDSPSRYESLGMSVGSAERASIAGEGLRALEVAESLADGHRTVTLAPSDWERGPPSPLAMRAITMAASTRGVAISSGKVTRVVGADRVEGVLVDGRVLPCDVFAFVPRRVPRTVTIPCPLGRSGGILVDACLRTSARQILAAGGCADVRVSSRAWGTLETMPRMSGRIAGANAAGKDLRIGPPRSAELVVFGLRWSRFFAEAPPRAPPWTELATIARSWAGSAACTIVYEKPSSRVVCVETVADASSGAPRSPAGFMRPASLESLAYGDFGSSDISLVSETARLGLKS